MFKPNEDYSFSKNLTHIRKKIVFALLGVVAIIGSGCDQAHYVETPTTPTTTSSSPPANLPSVKKTPTATTVSQEIALVPSELIEFDTIMLELDPDQQLVTQITQWKLSNTVNITTGPGFNNLSQERQDEFAIGMRNGLGQVCSCSPYLKLYSDSGQPLAEIGQQLQWQ